MRFPTRVIDAAMAGAVSALLIAPFTSVEARSPAGSRHGGGTHAGHGSAGAAAVAAGWARR